MNSVIDIKTIIEIIGVVVCLLIGINFMLKKYGHIIINSNKTLKNLRKSITITIILIIVGVIVYVAILCFAISGLDLQTDINNGQEIITTEYGDAFTLKYLSTNSNNYITDVSVYDESKKNIITNYRIKGDFVKPQVITIVNSPSIICYQVEQCIIYKKKDGNLKGINVFIETSPKDLSWNNKTKEFVDVAKVLVSKNEWKWIKVCGNLLLASGDIKIRKTLERYSSDNFTKEELDINKSSEIKKEDMVAFAKQTLEQK